MKLTKEDQIQVFKSAMNNIAIIGMRLDEILDGFKLYSEYKGSTDIETYMGVLETFNTAIEAMDEQLSNLQELLRLIDSAMADAQ